MKKSFACQNNVSSLSLSCPRQREHARLCWRLRVPELCSLTNQNTAEIHCCSSVHCAHVHEKCLRVPKRWRAVCVSLPSPLPPSLSPSLHLSPPCLLLPSLPPSLSLPICVSVSVCVGCLVPVGNGIELEAVGLRFEPYRWRPCGVAWDSSRTVVVIKLLRTSALCLRTREVATQGETRGRKGGRREGVSE